MGKLTRYSITYLRHLRDFFEAYFRLKPDPETSTVSQWKCLDNDVAREPESPPRSDWLGADFGVSQISLCISSAKIPPTLANKKAAQLSLFRLVLAFAQQVLVSCQGIGFKNLSRGAT